VQEFSAAHDVVALPHAQLDATDDAAVTAALTAVRPELVVNCSGYNDVDASESHPVDALQVNAFAVRTLARVAERLGAALVHYGSDFVFDGTAERPYREEDATAPQSVYAASKMLGEWFALDAPRSYVLRVESLFGRAAGGPPSKGSVASIAKGLQEGTAPRVFIDRTVSPTHVADAARATRSLVEAGAAPGLYHCVNSGLCTWYEFAQELARGLGTAPRLTPVRMADVVLTAQRPKFCALSNYKLRQAGVPRPAGQDALARYVRELTAAPSP
jgi:dTDP-4-dehydrorhamnose reductase